MKIRSFLAFELPPEIKRTIARVSGELRETAWDVKWVRLENIHLTVVFMGNVEEEEIPSIEAEVQNVCISYGPFDVSLKGVGFFPNRRSPRVLWLGLDGDMERLSEFRDRLQGRLVPFGIKEEKRAFRPHLTLGRFRKYRKIGSQGAELLSKYQDVTSPVYPLKELILFRSDLKPGGAVYTKMAGWPFSGKQ